MNMSQRFNLADYVTVDERIDQYWAQYTDAQGSIRTEVVWVNNDGTGVAIKATVYWDDRILATGMAQEYEGPQGANRTSWWENCETSAIGRALANLGMSLSRNRPSREEMRKVERGPRLAPVAPPATPSATAAAPPAPAPLREAPAPLRAGATALEGLAPSTAPLTQADVDHLLNTAGRMVADGDARETVYQYLIGYRHRMSEAQFKDVARTWRALKEEIAERDAAIDARLEAL